MKDGKYNEDNEETCVRIGLGGGAGIVVVSRSVGHAEMALQLPRLTVVLLGGSWKGG